MRHDVRGRRLAFFLTGVLAYTPAARAADPVELDRFEEKCVGQAAERVLKAGNPNREFWLKELERAFPGKVAAAPGEDEAGIWFDLLAGKTEDWHRDADPRPYLADLFDKAARHLDVGPVPAITRDEFRAYAARALQELGPPEDGPAAAEDADKVFRTLDRDRDGELGREELPAGLKADRADDDADGNGRISRDEYRVYFRKRVAARADELFTTAKPASAKAKGKTARKAGPARPEWFAAVDLDKDGQISLFEWRQCRRVVAVFKMMDLDDDGLLTHTEYVRYLKLKMAEDDQKKREDQARTDR